MKRNLKYIIPAILLSLLTTISIGYSIWIILSETVSNYVKATGEFVFQPTASSFYAGETWTTANADSATQGTIVYKYNDGSADKTVTLYGTYTIGTADANGKAATFTATPTVTLVPSTWIARTIFGDSIPVTPTLTLNAVAKIDDTFYNTIDAALNAATNGKTAVVLTAHSGEKRAKNARTIGYTSTATDPITIQAGVTLLIPYDEAVTASYTATTAGTATCTNLAYYTGTVNNYGTITISAVVTGDQKKPAKNAVGTRGTGSSVVAGSYAHLQNADANAKLVNAGASAVIHCYGYLDGTLMMDKGTANLLFSFMDHRGGRCMLQMANDKKAFPILRYYLASVGGNIHVQAGAVVNGRSFVEAGGQIFETPITLIGKADSSGFVTLADQANAVLNYDKDGGKNVIDLYGNATINEIAVYIKMLFVEKTISTADSTVPMSYLWEIRMHCLPGQSSASVSTGETDLSLLPGSKILVDEGVTLTVHDVAIYEAEACDILNQGYHVAYGDCDAAELLVKGTLEVTGSIGGEVKAGGAGAIFKNQSGAQATFTTNDITGFTPGSDAELLLQKGGEAVYTPTTRTLQLAKVSGSDSYSTLGTYYSAAKGEGYAWYSSKITLTLDAQNGTLPSGVSSPYAATVTTPSDGVVLSAFDQVVVPTRAYHTFSHWCTSSTCTNGSNCSTRPVSLYSDTPLYAIWIVHQHNINWKVTIDGDVVEGESGTLTTENFTIPNDTVAAEAFTAPTITDRKEQGLEFVGWSLIPDGATNGFSFAKSYLANAATKNANGVYERTIYAVWKSASYYPSFDFLNNNNPYNTTLTDSVGEVVGKYYPTNSEIISSTVLGYDTAFDNPYYFEGWYVKDANGNNVKYEVGSSPENYADADGKVTFYANWAPKTYMLTLTGEAAVNNVHHAVEGKSIYFNAAQMNEALLAEFSANADAAKGSDSTTTVQNYFGGWSIDDAAARNSANYTDYTENGYTFKRQTFSANWTPKYVITYNANDGTVSPTQVYCRPGEAVKLPTPTRTGYTFLGWYTAASDGIKIEQNPYTPTEDITLYAQWEKTAYTITVTTSKATVSGVTSGQTAYYGDTITFTVSFSENDNRTVSVKDANGNTITTTGSYTFTMPAGNVTISASSESCIAAGTLITLADGTQKKVEDVTMDDLLLVFNHETGRYEAAAITFIEDDGWDYYNVINLVFSDGTVTKLIYEHALFDLTLNKYVYITEQNYADFVGHAFAVQDGDTFGRVTLTEAFVEREYTGCYSLVTAYHLNYLIDGLFSIPGGIDGLFNIFEYGDDLKYDEEKMNADIHEFGLFTYEEFASYYPEIPVEVYEMFPAKYFKVSIGKGMLTFEDISSYIEQFLIKNGII